MNKQIIEKLEERAINALDAEKIDENGRIIPIHSPYVSALLEIERLNADTTRDRLARDLEARSLALEERKLELEKRRQNLDAAKIAAAATGTIVGTVLAKDAVNRSMIFEQTGSFRTSASKMAQKMLDGVVKNWNALTSAIR